MADHPSAHLDERDLEAAERPVLEPPGQGEPPQEIAQVVRQDEEKEPHLVAHEPVTGKACPVQGVLAFLDPLLGCASLVVEVHDPLGSSRQVRDNESDAREEFA